MTDAVGFLDHELRVIALDEALARLTGVPAKEHIGRPLAEVAPAVWAELEPFLRRGLAGETLTECPFPAASADERDWQASIHPLAVGGELLGLALAVRDVAAARRVEEGLRLHTDLYAMLARTNRAVSRCRSADELYHEVCAIAVETGGFRFAWVGLPDGELIVPVATAGHDPTYLDEVVITLDPSDPRSQGPTGRAVRTGERVVINDFGTSTITAPWHDRLRTFGFAASAAFPITEGNHVAAVLTVYADRAGFFTDELVSTLSELTPSLSFALDAFAAERDRRRDEADLHLRDRAMQSIAQGIVIIDARDDALPVVYASPSFERVTGYSQDEVVGRHPRFLRGPDTDLAATALLDEAFRRQEACSVELLNYRKDGTPFWNAVTISPVTDADGVVTHFVGVQTDVTEKRELEDHMQQVQRLEALGQLAGGVAHDFNNLLTVIMGSAVLGLQTADRETQRALDDILNAGERATGLVRQLLAFSRQQAASPGLIDLNEVVTDAKRMLDRLIETSIELRYELADEPVTVTADRGQLEQVLVNLAVNARDAMPGGGTLTIRTGARDEDASPVGTLTVADTGTGIDPALRDKIFLPFFTTKEAGAGTGLGLAAVYGIVAGAGGRIDLESAPDAGSSFTVSLPLVDATPASERRRVTAVPADRIAGIQVLLVEDDADVRAVTEELLLASGCELVLVATPERAIELARDGEPFDLLVTDLVMPKINGIELARAIRQHRPALPVLFVSGYPQDKYVEAITFPNSAYVQKPFTLDALADDLSRLLGDRVEQ